MEQPSILVRILHSVPHVNYTFQRVNDTFNPDSDIYVEVGCLITHKRLSLSYVYVGMWEGRLNLI